MNKVEFSARISPNNNNIAESIPQIENRELMKASYGCNGNINTI